MEGKRLRPLVKLTKEQGQQIVARRRQGETFPSLAASFGVSETTVGRVLRGEYRGWPPPPKPVRVLRSPHGKPRGGRLLTPAQVREIRALRKEGWLLSAIGTRFGTSDTTICRILSGIMYSDVGEL